MRLKRKPSNTFKQPLYPENHLALVIQSGNNYNNLILNIVVSLHIMSKYNQLPLVLPKTTSNSTSVYSQPFVCNMSKKIYNTYHIKHKMFQFSYKKLSPLNFGRYLVTHGVLRCKLPDLSSANGFVAIYIYNQTNYIVAQLQQ